MRCVDYWDKRNERHGENLKAVMAKPIDNTKQIFDLYSFFDSLYTGLGVVDYGCGNGRLTEVVASIFDSYVGVDISHKMVQLCKDNYPEKKFYHLEDYTDIPNGDVLFCYTVLLHVPPEELKLLSDVVKKRFKYTFIAQHVGPEVVEGKKSDHCFNLYMEDYINIFNIEVIKSVEYTNTGYGDSKITYMWGRVNG